MHYTVNMDTILVTGGTGHLGNVLVRTLVAEGNEVRILVLPEEDTSCLDGLSVERLIGDVRNYESLVKAMEGVDYVFHLAGIVTVSTGLDKLLEEVNVGGTRNVIRACREAGVKRLVYTSSIHALKDVPHGITIDESIPVSPEGALGAYGKSKARATMEVLAAAREGLDAVVICPTGVIGPFDYRPSAMGRLLLYLLKKPFRSVPVGTYNFVDVRDIADGEIRACRRGKSGEIYILSGEQTSIADYGRIAAFFAHRPIRPSFVPHWLCRVGAVFSELVSRKKKIMPIFTREALDILRSNCRIRCDKARRQLGFKPRALSETVRDTVEWFNRRRGTV